MVFPKFLSATIGSSGRIAEVLIVPTLFENDNIFLIKTGENNALHKICKNPCLGHGFRSGSAGSSTFPDPDPVPKH